MRNKKVLFLTQAAVIAAIYVVLTIFISAFNLASGAIHEIKDYINSTYDGAVIPFEE